MDTKKARKWAARKLGELLQYVKFESQNITIRINLLQYLNVNRVHMYTYIEMKRCKLKSYMQQLYTK